MERGELPETSLLASVPVSVRSESKRAGRNQVSSMFCRLGTDIEDPLERITGMASANVNAKEHHKAVPADTLQEWAEFAAPRTFGLAVRMVSDLRLAERAPVIHNLVISNVPGPPVPLYFVGSRIDALYPLGPVFHGAGLNLTVMSNNGQMHIGAIACQRADAQAVGPDRPVPGRARGHAQGRPRRPESAKLVVGARSNCQALAGWRSCMRAEVAWAASRNAGTKSLYSSTQPACPHWASWIVAPGMRAASSS